MPRINLADVDTLIEDDEEGKIEDRREKVREKELKTRFKENRDIDG